MNQTDTTVRSESESAVDTARTEATSDRDSSSKAVQSLRQGVSSGAVPALVGGASILGGIRALRRGERKRGLTRFAFGTAFLAAVLARRRSRSRGGQPDDEESDVAVTGPEGTAVDEAGETKYSTGQADATEASSAVQSEETTDEETTDAGEGTQAEDIERLGTAALDRQSREVPAPQRAFNQRYLAQSAEAIWGIRDRDDAVLVSQDYDAIQDRDGVRYVASSEVGQDVRELPVPDAVLNHWDEVYGGGTAVTGGDDILFVTTDDLAADHLLRVLPAAWADDLPE